MVRKNLFNQETGKFKMGDVDDTQKKARIVAKTSQPRLEVRGQSKVLSNKAFSIGRDKSNQIIIADAKVSRHHAIVSFSKMGEAFIKDTDSVNGTYVNGKQIPYGKNIKLKDGDKIKVGTTMIKFYS